jgi:hypothetical protein
MEINKKVTSRKGNAYNVNLTLNGDSVETITVSSENGDKFYFGGGRSEDKKKENYLVKLIEDVILNVEEKYSNYEALKLLEDWDGVIH